MPNGVVELGSLARYDRRMNGEARTGAERNLGPPYAFFEVWTMEPYVYSQFITGKDHPYRFGRARNSWLTGTASWAFVAISQYILGVRADYDGLVVDPTIPSDWPGYEVTRAFRGATYRIRVTNPEGLCHGVRSLTVDGQPVEGATLPVAPPGKTVDVDVVLG